MPNEMTGPAGIRIHRRSLLGTAALLGLAAPAMLAVQTTAVDATEAKDPFGFEVHSVPEQVSATTGTVDVNGVKLWYWDTGGKGEAIVLVHPASVAADVWVYQQPVFAAAGYRVIGYSRRGYKNSESGPAENRGTAAGDLDGLIQALSLDRVHLVGVAAGGIYVTDYALAHPDRVRSITIACSLVTVDDSDYMADSSALRPEGFRQMPASFQELGPAYRAANPAGTAAWSQIAQTAVHDSFRQGLENKMTLSALEGLSVPTLFLTGDADLYTPPPMMKRMADRVRNREAAVVEGAGHAAFWEQPTSFNKIVLEFIGKQAS